MLMLPCFASKQTYARIDYLRTDDNWWGEKTLIVLNSSLKTIQNKCTVNTREWATARKTCRLATASASGCRTCCSWATATASWKSRNNRPSASNFQLVETAWNNFHPTTFYDLTAFCHKQMEQNSYFIVSLSSISYTYRVISLVLQHKDINSPQFVEVVCRNTKI